MKQELKLLLKQRSVGLLLLLSVAITWFSLQNGWQTITHIQSQIKHAQQDAKLRQQQQLAEYQALGHIDAGEVGYYVFHNVYQHPQEWSFIALGNRLVTPYVQRIRLLGLQGQLYDGESHHPEHVMLGGFDYAFWLVFFSPLLCIALMHDLKASEHQAGRLLLIHSLTPQASYFWAKRIALRWLLIVLTLLLPLSVFAVTHALSLQPLVHVSLVSIAYTLFWTFVCAAISARKQALNASTNAMLLACIWLFLSIILPNLAGLWLNQRYPVQAGSQIALQHRQLVHGAWDLPKKTTLQPFYKRYPQWQKSAPVTGRFHWKWYYAFQHMADVNLNKQVQQREQALLQRDEATAALPLPGVWVQRTLEQTAKSSVMDLLTYRQQITAFHDALRHYFYPYFFNEQEFLTKDFAGMPQFNSHKTAKQ